MCCLDHGLGIWDTSTSLFCFINREVPKVPLLSANEPYHSASVTVSWIWQASPTNSWFAWLWVRTHLCKIRRSKNTSNWDPSETLNYHGHGLVRYISLCKNKVIVIFPLHFSWWFWGFKTLDIRGKESMFLNHSKCSQKWNTLTIYLHNQKCIS